MRPLVIIPARGNSKGLPGKNIKPLNGMPLILYTLKEAQKLFPDERICVSTDSEDIAGVVKQSGYTVPFIRPESLATDTAGTRGVVLHAIDFYQDKGLEVDEIVLLQPTSPFRTADHIKEALSLYSPQIDMIVSVRETSANPYFSLFEEGQDGFLHRSKESNAVRRQDIPSVWEFNGAIYIFASDSIRAMELFEFTKIRKYVMDEYSSVDIDTDLDWVLAEYIIKNQNGSQVSD